MRPALRDPIIGVSALSVLAYLAGFAMYWAQFRNGVGPNGQPFGHDFYCFWSAGRMALSGHGPDVWNPQIFQTILDRGLPGQTAIFPWNYPPAYLVAVTPFALLPLPFALMAFQISTFTLFASALVRRAAAWRVAAFAAASGFAVLTLSYGQNGFLFAGLLGWALWGLLNKRLVLAGVMIGLMTLKPHLGLLLPIALIAARQWRVMGVAAVTTVCVQALGVLLFGTSSLMAFIAALQGMSSTVEGGQLGWQHMPTFYAGLRALHVPDIWAQGVQLAVLMGAMVFIYRQWSRGVTPQTLAVLGAIMAVSAPYLLVYDLCLLMPGIALWWRAASVHGLRRFEALFMLIAVFIPSLISAAHTDLNWPLGWCGVAAVVGLTAWGCRRHVVD